MKFKLNPGDIGVYITFGLFFAGVGLVVGSYLASKKGKEEPELEDLMVDYVNPNTGEVAQEPIILDTEERASDQIYRGNRKPSLDELVPDDIFDGVEDDVPEEEIIGERYLVVTEDPRESGKAKRIVTLEYNESEDSILRLMGGHYVPVEYPESMLGEGTLDAVLDRLLYLDIEDVFVLDTSQEKWFSVSMHMPQEKRKNGKPQ